MLRSASANEVAQTYAPIRALLPIQCSDEVRGRKNGCCCVVKNDGPEVRALFEPAKRSARLC